MRAGVLQLKHYLSLLPPRTSGYGLLLAPFISEESAHICTEAGIGYADLAGNSRLSFDQVFIETRAAENPFHEKRTVKSVFSPKATRVLRVLLGGPLRSWKVKELALEAARCSPYSYLKKPVIVLVQPRFDYRPMLRFTIKAYVLDVRLERRLASDITERLYEALGEEGLLDHADSATGT